MLRLVLEGDLFPDAIGGFADGASLCALASAGRAAARRAVETARRTVEAEYGWLRVSASHHWSPSAGQTRGSACQAVARLEGGGRLLLVGGTQSESVPTSAVTKLAPTAGTVLAFKGHFAPTQVARSAACCVVAPGTGDLYVIGGWDGDRALDTVETYSTSNSTSVEQDGDSDDSSSSDDDNDNDNDNDAAPSSVGSSGSFDEEGSMMEDSARTGLSGVRLPRAALRTVGAAALLRPIRMRRRRPRWVPLGAPMAEARCFTAAAFTPWSATELAVVGGGDSLYVGGTASERSEAFDGTAWRAYAALNEARCGHGLAATRDGALVTCGGYGGGTDYLASTEVLRDGAAGWTLVAPMAASRSGHGLAAGPDGAVYVAGGSPDGHDALRTAERFDPRSPTWQALPPMNTRRSYVSATVTSRREFVVHGGYDEWGDVLATAECFDLRAHQWRTLHGDAASNGSSILESNNNLVIHNAPQHNPIADPVVVVETPTLAAALEMNPEESPSHLARSQHSLVWGLF